MATINYAEKYSNVLDEKFKVESKSDQCVNKDYDFVGAKTVKVQSVNTVELGDYSRTGMSRFGTPNELENSVQEMTMSQDKSFTFTIDKMNEDETAGAIQAGTALSREVRERVIPAVDAYRFGVMASKAGHIENGVTLTASNVYEKITDATAYLDDKEVPAVGRQLVVTSTTYNLMKKSKDIVLDTEVGQDMKLTGVVANLDGMTVIKVPSGRLPEGFQFMITNPIASTAPVKLAEYRVHTDVPGISGSLVEGRIYHDCFVLDNKKDTIYYVTSKAAASTSAETNK